MALTIGFVFDDTLDALDGQFRKYEQSCLTELFP